jgi:hypothetical protein
VYISIKKFGGDVLHAVPEGALEIAAEFFRNAFYFY